MLGYIFSLDFLWYFVLIPVYVAASLGLIVVVLLQKGKGVGFAGAFGAGGGTDTVFGPRSSKSLPQRLTYTMAGLFVFLALGMSMLTDKVNRGVAPDLVPTEDTTGSQLLLNAIGKSDESTPAEAPAPEAMTPEVTPTEETAPAAVPPVEPAPAEAAPAPAPVETDAAPAEASPPPAADSPAGSESPSN